MKPRTPTKLFQLLDICSAIWQDEYKEPYLRSGKDWKHGKEFLELNGGDFEADDITAKYNRFIATSGIYADRRHQFSDFIRNVSSFSNAKPKMKVRVGSYQIVCRDCDTPYWSHFPHRCPDKSEPNDAELRKEFDKLRKEIGG